MLSVQTHLMKWWPSIIASVLCVQGFFFFPFKKFPKPCLIMQGAWSPCGEAVLKVSWLQWIAGHHTLYKVGVNHLLQWTQNLSRALLRKVFSFKCSFLFDGSLRVFCCLIIGSFPFSKKISSDICFLFTLGRVSMWASQNWLRQVRCVEKRCWRKWSIK